MNIKHTLTDLNLTKMFEEHLIKSDFFLFL